MRLRKQLSTEEHDAVASRLLAVIAEMEELGKLALDTYRNSSRLGRLGMRFYASGYHSQLQEFRSELDNAWYREGHERAARNPYYGDYANAIKDEARKRAKAA